MNSLKPLFSIVMPSFLGPYKTAAKDREKKILRAVDSVLNQSIREWELLIVADGCEKTFEIVSSQYINDDRINCFLIEKQPLWSGGPRNVGIKNATADYIVYLDIDDYYGQNHLKIIHQGIQDAGNPDWVWFNDYVGEKSGRFHEVERNILKKYDHGTCNICHSKSMDIYWPEQGNYLHDFDFIGRLKSVSDNYIRIATPEYYVCHIPNKLDI